MTSVIADPDTANAAADTPWNVRLRNNDNCSIGAALNSSIATKPTRQTAASTNSPMISWLDHP